MSMTSNEERDSMARRTTGQPPMNSTLRGGTTMQGTLGGRQKKEDLLLMPPVPKRDHRKFDKEKPMPYLDLHDFMQFMDEAFEGERPELVDDLVYHLTGVEMMPMKQSIREDDEFANRRPNFPNHTNDESMMEYKRVFKKE